MTWGGKALISVSLIIGAFFAGSAAMTKFVSEHRTMHVKGLTEMNVKADLGVWNIPLGMTKNDLEEGKKAFSNNIKIAKDFFIENGLKPEEITIESPSISEHSYEKTTKVTFKCTLTIKTENVDLLNELSKKTFLLMERGVMLKHEWSGSMPRYIVKNFDTLRPQLISQATKSALIMAEQLAKDSNVKVGALRSADQGTIEETHPNREENVAGSIIKKLRLVSHFTFYIR